MLDDANVLSQRDPENALGIAATEYEQTTFAAEIVHGEHDGRAIKQIVVAGMGGSALAPNLVKSWLASSLEVPFEVVRTYKLPHYVDANTLVILSSYSGNTEETVGAFRQAMEKGAQLAVITSGGKLMELAEEHDVAAVYLPAHIQPRMALIDSLRAVIAVFGHFNLVDPLLFGEIADAHDWLQLETSAWLPGVTVDSNYAKQLALFAVGKTPVFYAGTLMAPVAYKWKISWNENAKNVAFWNELPEFNHNEFIGWVSHPIEKPFAIFDLVSSFEHPRVLKRFEVSDRLLSGRRPKANTVNLQGDSPLQQMLWGCVLADFVSVYVAVLNSVDPTPVELVERLKRELS